MLIKRSFSLDQQTQILINRISSGAPNWGWGGDPTSWLTWDISVYVCPPVGITSYISSHTQRVLVGMINY